MIRNLAADQPLLVQYLDHSLKGNLQGFRECHIKPDLILIYRNFKDGTLQLARVGSHSQFGIKTFMRLRVRDSKVS